MEFKFRWKLNRQFFVNILLVAGLVIGAACDMVASAWAWVKGKLTPRSSLGRAAGFIAALVLFWVVIAVCVSSAVDAFAAMSGRVAVVQTFTGSLA